MRKHDPNACYRLKPLARPCPIMKRSRTDRRPPRCNPIPWASPASARTVLVVMMASLAGLLGTVEATARDPDHEIAAKSLVGPVRTGQTQQEEAGKKDVGNKEAGKKEVGNESERQETPDETSTGETKKPEKVLPSPPVSPKWLRLAKDHEIWLDPKLRSVVVGGRVCLREGQLEMFACPRRTKEHESVVSVNTPARFVHAGLVALGAKPGRPVQYEPNYVPAEGMEVVVELVWKDPSGELHRMPGQQWVKNVKTDKPLAYPWVFVGSGFWTDEATGERYYYADSGEFICVSNFASALLDLPIQSSQANNELLYVAYTENIPPRGTPVQLVLTPRFPKKENPNSARQPVPGKRDEPGTESRKTGTDAKRRGTTPAKGASKEASEGASRKGSEGSPGTKKTRRS